ncbi:MAG TPA: P22 phage major capsid protein family protein [Anaerolineales bacterium]
MTANTLTGLVMDAQVAADRVLREQTGFLGAVFMDASAEMVAKDQNITYPIVPTMAASDITPAAVPTDPTGQVVGYGQMTISKSRKVPFRWSGEEQKSVNAIYNNVRQDQIAQAIRTLINEVESDLFLAAKRGASRAYGTAGTTPFGTVADLSDVANIRQILTDNGAWTGDMHFVLSTSSGTNIRSKQSSLFKVNEAGDAELLREGTLGRLQGFAFGESAQIVSHTKGTASGYLVDLTAGYAAGSETVHIDTGTGTVLAGDVLTNTKTARDTNKYIVHTGFAGDGDGDIVLAKPGNKVAWVNNDPVAVGSNYTGNFSFERNAIHLLARLPELPKEGALGEHEIITDPYSGMSFLLSMYPGYHMVITEISLAWGVKAVKSEAIATLLG